MMEIGTSGGRSRRLAALIVAALAATLVRAQAIPVERDGSVAVPAFSMPASTLMSAEGNQSRVEHILTERSLKGRPIAEINAALFGPRLERMKAAFPITITRQVIGGVGVLVYEPRGGVAAANRRKVLVNLHGGGFVGCFLECGGLESIPIAALTGMRVVSVDYRLAPAYRYPAGSQDAAAVYRELLKTVPAQSIGIYGCSAGGLLTAQSLVWFRSHGLPRPAAAGIFCAGGDPGMSGDSRIIGNLLGDGEMPAAAAASPLGYMAGTARTEAEAFPANDRKTLAAFPPTLVIAGTRDFALSSAVNLHSKLVAGGVDARLNVWEGGRHAFFYDVRIPEAHEVYVVVSTFFKQRLGRLK